MKVTKLFFSLIIILIVAGCSGNLGSGETRVYETKHPDAKEVLSLDPDADIFQFDGLVYQTNIDWVEELSLTKDNKLAK